MNHRRTKVKAYGLDTVLDFGRYKDRSIKDMCYIDPSYVLWCSRTLPWFDLSVDAEELAHQILREMLEYEPLDYMDFFCD